MIVSYRPIEEFPGYRVGDDASVWKWLKGIPGTSCRPPRWKKRSPCFNDKGSLGILLWKDGKGYRRTIASLVLKVFVGPRPLGFESFFLDDNRSNCSLSNLRWAPKGSSQIGRSGPWKGISGEAHPTCTISDNEVDRIRAIYATGEFNQYEIAELMHINQAYVSRIVRNESRQMSIGVKSLDAEAR